MIAALDTEMRLAREIRSALREERSGGGRDLAAAQIMAGLASNSPQLSQETLLEVLALIERRPDAPLDERQAHLGGGVRWNCRGIERLQRL